ncbi:hypothetical protein LCGC14_1373490, partial [marine sediment metagenome]
VRRDPPQHSLSSGEGLARGMAGLDRRPPVGGHGTEDFSLGGP